VEWVLLRSSIGVDGVVNEFVVLSVDDVVLVLADYVHGWEHVQCIVNSSLHVFKVHFVAELLVQFQDFVSDVSACCVGTLTHALEDRSAQKHQLLVFLLAGWTLHWEIIWDFIGIRVVLVGCLLNMGLGGDLGRVLRGGVLRWLQHIVGPKINYNPSSQQSQLSHLQVTSCRLTMSRTPSFCIRTRTHRSHPRFLQILALFVWWLFIYGLVFTTRQICLEIPVL
jgi:hypothetical protein